MNLYIDPSYEAYNNNKLFDLSNTHLNRDDTLKPYWKLRQYAEKLGHCVATADILLQKEPQNIVYYWSMGLLKNMDRLQKQKNVIMDAFFIMEPPVVAPKLYESLPQLTTLFRRVYIHNIRGDGYSLKNVERSKLKKLYWPQPNEDVHQEFWRLEDRRNTVVVINGQHKPRAGCKDELYSKRIQVAVKLSEGIGVDLYGQGWNQIYSRNSLWWMFLRNFSKIQELYKGTTVSKLKTLSEYDFCLCFENMNMEGYITEKIFDCFYAGTIPIYYGSRDIEQLIPSHVYIDFRQFDGTKDLVQFLKNMNQKEKLTYRENARAFLKSSDGQRYSNSFHDVFEEAFGPGPGHYNSEGTLK